MKNHIGQVGVITTWDNVTLWEIAEINESGLIVLCCDNSEDQKTINPDEFWVLVDTL
jgi:intracellular sulfur oxidation DsrE/DsrF family protein